MKLRDIPQFTRAKYEIDVPWSYLQHTLDRYGEDGLLNLDPDFQRAHVWTVDQQIKFVEFSLRGGASARNIYFNCCDWMNGFKGIVELVDGKQRIAAVLAFINNEIPVFGLLLKDYEEGKLYPFEPSFRFHINDLKTRKEVLQWYLDFNDGGVVHTNDELDKVRKLLAQE